MNAPFSHNAEVPDQERWLQDDPDLAAGPVRGLVFDAVNMHHIPVHSHRRAQLLHVVYGIAVVTAAGRTWTVPPHRALWLPAMMPHAVRYPANAEMRSLFFEPTTMDGTCPPDGLQIYHLDSFCQALLREAASLDWDCADLRHLGRLTLELLFLRVQQKVDLGFDLPDGYDPRLRRATDFMRRFPANRSTLQELASLAGCSRRSLARLFEKELGMPPATWRRQMRLQLALEGLAAKVPVSQLAIDLGYSNSGNFTVAFRAAFGTTPSAFFS